MPRAAQQLLLSYAPSQVVGCDGKPQAILCASTTIALVAKVLAS